MGSHDWIAGGAIAAGWSTLPVVCTQRALLLDVPLALFFAGALVVRLLAARNADLDLGAIALPVHGERDQGQALALDRADQLVDFGAMQQQLAGAAIVGNDMGRGRDQRRDRCPEQEQLAALDQRVGIGEVDAARAQAFDFPSLQRDAGLVALVDVVLVASALVQGDCRSALGIVVFFPGHARYNGERSRARLALRAKEYSCRSIAMRWFATRRNRCSTSSTTSKLTRDASPGAWGHTSPSMMTSTWWRGWTCALQA